MNFVPEAGEVPCTESSCVPAVAVMPVVVTGKKTGSAGGVLTWESPFSEFTVFTFM
jgi:hypothetical protein